MKVLIVGSGGREHAIAWSVSKSPKVDKIYCAPGNAGIAELAECVDIGAMEFEKLADFAQEKAIDLTIIGMDDPLVGGVVDVFEARGLKVFGPRKNAAILEGSKAFSKDLMKKYNIPTAAYENFDDPEKALEYLRTEARFPIVLKADGLALGKGVLICQDLKEAEDGVKEIMEDKKFGNAGNTMVIEEFMTGREVSVLSFVDGKTIRTMTSAQDHKRAQDGDQGLNTGGMGTFSPSPFYTEEVDEFCRKYVYQPTVDAMAAEGRPFKGIIFFGLMLTPDGPKVLEYNARFGDPEAQVVLPLAIGQVFGDREELVDELLYLAVRQLDGGQLMDTLAQFPHIAVGKLQGFTGILHPEQNIFGVACSPNALCSTQCQIQSVLADYTNRGHGYFHTRTAIVTVEEHKIWGYFVTGDDVLLRQLCQHPDLFAALQRTSGFIGNTLAQQIIGELECFFVLHDAVTVRYDTKHGIISAADIGAIAGNHCTRARVDVAALDLPIQTSQFQSLTACRGIHNDTAKAVPRSFTNREHCFNVCRHNLYLQNFISD